MSGPVKAQGLFRAMGHSVDPSRQRAAHDFMPTPPEATRAFLAVESDAIRRHSDTVWEPAAGDGAMLGPLAAAGFDVVASDLVDRGCGAVPRSFYDHAEAPSCAVVTNPPYCEVNWRDGKGRWIEHALGALGVTYMALLLNWNWPAAAGLGGIWARFPPARAWLCRWKIDFTGEGAPPMLNAWFVWDSDAAPGRTDLLMLDRTDAAQAGLPGFAA